MALPQSALSELLDAFRTGDGVDLIRDAVRLVLQELSELEATERIGAWSALCHQPAHGARPGLLHQDRLRVRP